jgi:hypothetical protein
MPEKLSDPSPETLNIVRTSCRIPAFSWLLIPFAGTGLGQTAEVTQNVEGLL